MSDGFFMMGGDDLPPEVRAWIEEQIKEAMGPGHGSGIPERGYLVAAINYVLGVDEDDLTDEKVKEDHERVAVLQKYVTDKLPAPTDWHKLNDADKVRVAAIDLYMQAVDQNPRTCIHRDLVQRDLLEIADHLDLTSGFGLMSVADTRVSSEPTHCGVEWETFYVHENNDHGCVRKPGHANRHRCECGATRVQH